MRMNGGAEEGLCSQEGKEKARWNVLSYSSQTCQSERSLNSRDKMNKIKDSAGILIEPQSLEMSIKSREIFTTNIIYPTILTIIVTGVQIGCLQGYTKSQIETWNRLSNLGHNSWTQTIRW